MAYADPDKRRAADREKKARRRAAERAAKAALRAPAPEPSPPVPPASPRGATGWGIQPTPEHLAERRRVADEIDVTKPETLQAALTVAIREMAQGVEGTEYRNKTLVALCREARALHEYVDLNAEVRELQAMLKARDA